jgi:hypothetical protein
MTIPSRSGSRPPRPARSQPGRVRQILLSLVPFISSGFLAFVPFLYIAATRRRRSDWLTCAGYLAAAVLTGVLLAVGPPALAGVMIMLLVWGGTVHSLIALRPSVFSPAAARPPAFAGPPFPQVAIQMAGFQGTGFQGSGFPATGFRTAGSGAPGQAPSQDAVVRAAQARIRQREEARKLVRDNPILARDLMIGRPDLSRRYDDGGLVDVNHVPADILVRCLGLAPAEASAVIAARASLGQFTSCAEVSTYASLPPDRLDDVADLMVFR